MVSYVRIMTAGSVWVRGFPTGRANTCCWPGFAPSPCGFNPREVAPPGGADRSCRVQWTVPLGWGNIRRPPSGVDQPPRTDLGGNVSPDVIDSATRISKLAYENEPGSGVRRKVPPVPLHPLLQFVMGFSPKLNVQP